MTPAALAALHAACFTTPRPWSEAEFASVLAALGALLVIAVGKWLAARTLRLRPAQVPEDLLEDTKEK